MPTSAAHENLHRIVWKILTAVQTYVFYTDGLVLAFTHGYSNNAIPVESDATNAARLHTLHTLLMVDGQLDIDLIYARYFLPDSKTQLCSNFQYLRGNIFESSVLRALFCFSFSKYIPRK